MSLSKLVADIKSLKIQGATQIAKESLRFLKTQPYSKWKRISKKLKKTRPTGVVLNNALDMAIEEKNVSKVINRLVTSRLTLAEKGQSVIKKNCNIMTKCHSADVIEMLKCAKRRKKKITVYALETEPKHQGLITAKELSSYGIKTIVIEDPACGYFMPKMDMVIVGADAIRKEGVYNKIGTYVLSLVAKKHKKPFYVVATTFKIDKRRKIEIEERPIDEIYKGIKETKNMKVRNPAFDKTPYNLITRVITEKGIMTPVNIKRMIK